MGPIRWAPWWNGPFPWNRKAELPHATWSLSQYVGGTEAMRTAQHDSGVPRWHMGLSRGAARPRPNGHSRRARPSGPGLKSSRPSCARTHAACMGPSAEVSFPGVPQKREHEEKHAARKGASTFSVRQRFFPGRLFHLTGGPYSDKEIPHA